MPHVYGLPFPLHEADKAELDKTLDDIRARIQKDAPRARRSGHLAYFDEEIGKIDTRDRAWPPRWTSPSPSSRLGESQQYRSQSTSCSASSA